MVRRLIALNFVAEFVPSLKAMPVAIPTPVPTLYPWIQEYGKRHKRTAYR
jgi:hypothetical protein